jgi:hypothetical protein
MEHWGSRGMRNCSVLAMIPLTAWEKAMMSEPTFVASRDGLCGFVLVVEDGQVDAYTPSGNLLGVFRDRIEAVEAVLQNGALCRAAT